MLRIGTFTIVEEKLEKFFFCNCDAFVTHDGMGHSGKAAGSIDRIVVLLKK